LYVDYKGLNTVTIKNRYPLPLINEIIDQVQRTQFFNKIDLKDTYYRIKIHPGDKWKTAFRTKYRHYKFLVIPIELINIPTAFQTYINQILKDLIDDFYIIYLNDILIFSKTEKEHMKHLQKVYQQLRKYKLYTKLSKCSFYQKKMEFLGFIINVEGV